MPRKQQVLKSNKPTLIAEAKPDNTLYGKVKSWFKNSETILLARSEMAIGFVVTVVSALDWSPFLSMNFDTGFSSRQAGVLGGIMITRGVFAEWARRRSTDDPLIGKPA